MLSALLLPVFLLSTVTAPTPATSAEKSGAANQQFDSIILNPNPMRSADDVCLKMRVYLFARNDGDAPKLVRETTCTTVRPYLHKTRKTPQARFVPLR